MFITSLKTSSLLTALRMLLLHSTFWMLDLESVHAQSLMVLLLFLPACVVVTQLMILSPVFIPTSQTLSGDLISGFLNAPFCPARMMMLTILTLTF